MTVSVTPAHTSVPAEPQRGYPRGSLGLDWLMLAVGLWPVAGAEYDAYTHITSPKLESPFTPAHATLYSGVLAVALVLALVMWRNHARGYAWTRSAPRAYVLTAVGVAILGVAGVGDVTWHLLFGIEKDIPAIVSPTHLLIIAGILLVTAGPLRAALARPAGVVRGIGQLPLLVSVLLCFSFLTVVLQFAHPFSYPFASAGSVDLFDGPTYPPVDPFLTEGLGLASILVQTALLMGFVLFLVRRWRLLPGALTILLTASALLLGATQGGEFMMVPAAFAAGLLGDVLLVVLRPGAERSAAFRLFAFALPMLLFGAYFLDLQLTGGIAWIIHLWTGATIAAGAIGWAMSYLVLGPAAEQDTAQPAGE